MQSLSRSTGSADICFASHVLYNTFVATPSFETTVSVDRSAWSSFSILSSSESSLSWQKVSHGKCSRRYLHSLNSVDRSAEVISEPTGASLVRYLITYGMAWVVWGIYRELNDSFWHGDAYQCILTLIVMIFLVVFGNNAISIEQLHTESGARATAIGSYLLAEFSLYSTQFWYS